MKKAIVGVLACVALFAAVQAQADPVADFYRGKQLTVVIGYGPGGGYDIYGRIMAKYIGKHIPGNPTVVVQNMPGAGSMRATNYIYEVAPKDGTYIATFARNMPLIGLLKTNPNIRFDPRKFTWLGSPSTYGDDAYILWARKDTRFKTIADVLKDEEPRIVLGATGEGGTGNDISLLLKDVLGLKIKLIPGYSDSGAINLAIERKELDGRFVGISSLSSTKPDWLKPDGLVRPLLQFARRERHPNYPDIPTARELAAKDARALALIEIAEMPYILSKPFAAPPGVPADRAAALQKAFMAANADPEYIQEAQKLGIDISPIDGAGVMEILERLAKTPPELLDFMREREKPLEGGG
jgi:tripartite-type tricarboxylate transporter receptor subunit TctC